MIMLDMTFIITLKYKYVVVLLTRKGNSILFTFTRRTIRK